MTAPDLLPCPFCGSPLTVGAMNVARCKTDECVLEHFAVDLDWPEKVAAWNTRATPAAMTPEVRALVEQWDAYVESMGCVMGEVERMAQQMRDALADQSAMDGGRDG